MQSPGTTGAAGKSIDPSARKERGPQDDKVLDDKGVFQTAKTMRSECVGNVSGLEQTAGF